MGIKKAWELLTYHCSEGLDALYQMICNSPTPIVIDMERLLLSSLALEIVQISEQDNILNAVLICNAAIATADEIYN